MKKYKAYILDDEPLAIQVIEQYLDKLQQFELCGTSTDPLQAQEALNRLNPDLVFLDIEMPEMNGLEMITLINAPVILTTAFREYAVEGFDLQVLDYLVKPIPFHRFMKAMNRFLELQPGEEDVSRTPEPAYILIRADRKTLKLELQRILYIKGLKDYVKIFMEGQHILSKSSLGNFHTRLPQTQFFRVHKSYVVALDKITAFTKQDVELGDIEIPIGREYKAAFLKQMEAASQ